MTTAAQLRRAGAYVPTYVPDHEEWPPVTLSSQISEWAVYTVAQVAALLGYHEKTVTRKIRTGEIAAKGPHYRVTGRAILDYLGHRR